MTRKYVVFAVLILSAGLSTVTVALIWRALSAQRIEMETARERARVERFLSLERWDDAAEAIRGVVGDIPEADEWVPFLRQARTVEEQGGIEGFALEIAAEASERFPDSARLRAIVVLLLLEEGSTEEAAVRAQSLPAGEFEGIVAEARLRSGEGRMPEGASDAAVLTRAVTDPSVERLEEAWEVSREPFFAHNAALRRLRRGDREHAWELALELPIGAPHSELAFLIAVEREAVEQAREYLRAIPPERQGAPEVLLARADLAQLTGDIEQRRLLIEDAIASSPEHDPVAYLALSEVQDTREAKRETLRTGLSVFPGNVPLALNLARLLEQQGDYEEAVSVLEQAEEQRGEPDVRLAYAYTQVNPEYSRARRRTATWELLEAFPESSEIGGHLA
ncbi:MAG: tetratricopeptide repeat protein, partial [Spirochaetota bacterium]